MSQDYVLLIIFALLVYAASFLTTHESYKRAAAQGGAGKGNDVGKQR